MTIRKLGLSGGSIALLAGLALATPSFAQSNDNDTQTTTMHRHHHHHAMANSPRENSRENRTTAQLNEQQLSQSGMAQNTAWSNSSNGAANRNGEMGTTYGSMSRSQTMAPAGAPGTEQAPGANENSNGVYYNNRNSDSPNGYPPSQNSNYTKGNSSGNNGSAYTNGVDPNATPSQNPSFNPNNGTAPQTPNGSANPPSPGN